jgi:hypothetical protein
MLNKFSNIIIIKKGNISFMLRRGGITVFGPYVEKATKCRKLHNELLNTS